MNNMELLQYKMDAEETCKANIADGILKAYANECDTGLYEGAIGSKRVAPEGWGKEYVYTIYISSIGYICVHELDDVPPRLWTSIETPQAELEAYIPIALDCMNRRYRENYTTVQEIFESPAVKQYIEQEKIF